MVRSGGTLVLLSGLLISSAPGQVLAVWGKAAENHLFAQQLVRELMAADSTLLSVAIHVVRPGETVPQIVGHTQDLIGKQDSPADMAMIAGDQIVIGPEMVEHTTAKISRMVVHAPLRDGANRVIGLAVFSFKRHDGPEKLEAHVRAEDMLAQLAHRIPSAAALLEPIDERRK